MGPFQGGELRLPAEPAASVARWTPRSPQSCSLADVGRPPRGRRPAGAAWGPWSLWVESGPVCATKCWGTCDTQLSDGDAISVQGAVCCHRHAGCPVADSCPGGPQATPQAQLTHRGPLGWGGPATRKLTATGCGPRRPRTPAATGDGAQSKAGPPSPGGPKLRTLQAWPGGRPPSGGDHERPRRAPSPEADCALTPAAPPGALHAT